MAVADSATVAHTAAAAQTTAAAPPAAVQPRGVSRHAWIEKIICSDGSAILRMLWKLLGNEQDVLDAYQDCWCSLAALAQPEGLRSARAFAYRTATNIAIEMIRRKARRRDHWGDVVQSRTRETQPVEGGRVDGSPGEDPRGGDSPVNLRGAIARLPQHLQNVIVLRDLGRLSYKEVARILGIEGGTARVYRRQAVVRLAEILHERPDP
ncbi:MAG: RNA polymerase sigma factor [Phycisphaerales bacterium]|nr:RNA polymerase sigma factor [Phycisphaerales bacterium]